MAGLLKLLLEVGETPHDSEIWKSYLCNVVDLAISCLQEHDPYTTPSTAGTCPRMWAFANCWKPSVFNSTTLIPCSVATSTNAIANPADLGHIALHCNATSKGWNNRTGSHNCFDEIPHQLPTYLPTADPAVYNLSDISAFGNYSNNGLEDYQSEELNSPTPSSLDEETSFYILSTSVTIGHTLSLVSLIIALLLLGFLRRLHCTRIYIHMNLMAAFVLRGFIWILHVTAFQDPDSIDDRARFKMNALAGKIFLRYQVSDLPLLDNLQKEYCVTQTKEDYIYVWCRVYYVMQNYLVTANYYWLLVEGLYLALLLKAVIFNQKKCFKGFCVLGWVLPWASVIGSVLAKVLDENEYNGCWFEDKNSAYWWIIKVPILFSLLVNFGIFVMVICVLGSKLRESHRRRITNDKRDDFKWRLTKSTLALIPLLGIQYVVTAFVEFRQEKSTTDIFVRKTIELTFTSIQGLFVAIIYCFCNGEVQDECKKTWRRWKLRCEMRKRDHDFMRYQRRKRASTTTSLTNIYSYLWTRKNSAVSTTSTRTTNHHNSHIALAPTNSNSRFLYSDVMLTDVMEFSTDLPSDGGVQLNGIRLNGTSLRDSVASSSNENSRNEQMLKKLSDLNSLNATRSTVSCSRPPSDGGEHKLSKSDENSYLPDISTNSTPGQRYNGDIETDRLIPVEGIRCSSV
ncbi:vasoactive intestinal polypeptide receptor 1-like [Clavelina lepadiformis]|uniref:vasoactive intestinal polypeptide receptor 1-like n=1 Tax=Clavelina lepadiformis TaxID=159417 RepID=UPI004041DAA8